MAGLVAQAGVAGLAAGAILVADVIAGFAARAILAGDIVAWLSAGACSAGLVVVRSVAAGCAVAWLRGIAEQQAHEHLGAQQIDAAASPA